MQPIVANGQLSLPSGVWRRLASGIGVGRQGAAAVEGQRWLMRFSSSARIERMSSKLAGSERYMSRIAW